MSKIATTSRAYKFGVEIEISQVAGIDKWNTQQTISKIASAINAVGVRANSESLSHETRRYWKVVTDSSCGYEVVSPILYDFVELELVTKALKTVGAKIDKKCGLHVHHDIADMKIEKIKNLFRLYSKHEEVLDSMMPESRRLNNNMYSKSIDANRMETIENSDSIQALKNNIGGAYQGHYTGERYYKLNFASYVCFGTVEFRQHSATIEFEKISNWVKITHKIVERADMRINVKSYSDVNVLRENSQLVGRFLKEIELSGTDVAEYVSKRIKSLKHMTPEEILLQAC